MNMQAIRVSIMELCIFHVCLLYQIVTNWSHLSYALVSTRYNLTFLNRDTKQTKPAAVSV